MSNVELNDAKLESVIRKVQGLLATAKDQSNEHEAQAAFMMAQKLMIKYQIELSQVESKADEVNIVQGQGSAHKNVRWYEQLLSTIIADTFRVKTFLEGVKRKYESKYKRAIMFYGLDADVKIAKELYILALDALLHHTKIFVDEFYEINELPRERSYTAKLKNSYMQGFLGGLGKKMTEQRFQLQEEYGLVVLMPKVVEEHFELYKESFDGESSYAIPSIEETVAYIAGYKKGQAIDYTKTTLDNLEKWE